MSAYDQLISHLIESYRYLLEKEKKEKLCGYPGAIEENSGCHRGRTSHNYFYVQGRQTVIRKGGRTNVK